jgi:hypothetical protein|nr:MAG TPA: Protein of unknown function (DUF2746) [Caudoviricetes sp.]
MINAAAALVTAVTAMVSGIMIGRSRSRSEREEQAEAIAAIKVAAEQAAEQTTNSHGTNLRDDLTAVQDRVDLVLDALAAESRARREKDEEFGRKLDAVALSARIDHSEIFQRVAALERTTSDCSLSRLPRDPEGVV